MKNGLLILAILLAPLTGPAATSGQLLLRGRVPATAAVVWSHRSNSYQLKTNQGRHSLRTIVHESEGAAGLRYVVVIPQ